MLILTRRPGESLFIGHEIEVVILGARAHKSASALKRLPTSMHAVPN